MGLALKYVVITKAKTFHYRRRVPKWLVRVLGKSEFKRLLGETEREALKNYPKVNALYERMVDEAKTAARDGSASTPLEVHRLAEIRAAELADMRVYFGGRELRGSDPEAADLIRDSIVSDSSSSDPVERRAANLLANRGSLPKPAPTIEDAKKLYLRERVEGDINQRKRAVPMPRQPTLRMRSLCLGEFLERTR
jgi:hypothetical protein